MCSPIQIQPPAGNGGLDPAELPENAREVFPPGGWRAIPADQEIAVCGDCPHSGDGQGSQPPAVAAIWLPPGEAFAAPVLQAETWLRLLAPLRENSTRFVIQGGDLLEQPELLLLAEQLRRTGSPVRLAFGRPRFGHPAWPRLAGLDVPVSVSLPVSAIPRGVSHHEWLTAMGKLPREFLENRLTIDIAVASRNLSRLVPCLRLLLRAGPRRFRLVLDEAGQGLRPFSETRLLQLPGAAERAAALARETGGLCQNLLPYSFARLRRCFLPRQRAVIRADGRLLACLPGHGQGEALELADLRESSFPDAWRSPRAASARSGRSQVSPKIGGSAFPAVPE